MLAMKTVIFVSYKSKEILDFLQFTYISKILVIFISNFIPKQGQFRFFSIIMAALLALGLFSEEFVDNCSFLIRAYNCVPQVCLVLGG